jgi:hypothetical protein
VVVRVAQAGVDTWSPAWYVGEGSQAERAMQQLATVPVARGRAIEERIAGHRVGWFPASRMVFAEGHPGGDRLASPEVLPAVLAKLYESIVDYGIDLPLVDYRPGWLAGDVPERPGFAGVRRLDSTLDLRFQTRDQGLSVLRGVASLGLPRAQLALRHQPGVGRTGALETVAFYGHGGRKMLARWYDKGVEAGTYDRGLLIRPEDQRRYVKASRRSVNELGVGYVRERFRQRFLPLFVASEGITVGGTHRIAQRLAELRDDGALTPRTAQILAGFAVLENAGQWEGPRRSRMRYRRQLRDHGLVLSELPEDDQHVDLHEVLGEAMETDAWERQG